MSENSNRESSGANGSTPNAAGGANNSGNFGNNYSVTPPQMQYYSGYAAPQQQQQQQHQQQQYYAYQQQGAVYGHQGDVYYGQQYYGQGGAASNENYEQDDYDNLDEIEKEMNKATLNTKTEDEEESALKELIQSDRKDEIQQKPAAPSDEGGHHAGGAGRGGGERGGGGRGGGGAFLPAGATPHQNGVLSPHAAEFWFPECRNCPCCKGFKHGCVCRAPGTQWAPAVDTCTDPRCLDPNAPPPPEPAAPPAGAAPSPTSRASSAPSSAPTPPGEFCKFEASPSGCRFGISCRFLHSNSSSSGNTGGPPPATRSPGSRAPNKCIYFQRGNCQYGESCRFSHF